MSNLGKTILEVDGRAVTAALTVDMTDVIWRLKILFNPYRPELRYMRGAGPKWLAKHGQPLARTDSDFPSSATLATDVRLLTDAGLQSIGPAAIYSIESANSARHRRQQ